MVPPIMRKPLSKRWRGLLTVLIFVVSDLALFNLSFLLAYWIRPWIVFLHKPHIPLANYSEIILLANFVCLFIFSLMGLYRFPSRFFDPDDFFSLAEALLAGGGIVLAATFLRRDYSYSRFTLAATFILAIPALSFSRWLILSWIRAWRRKSGEAKAAVIWGAGETGQLLLRKIQDQPDLGYRVIGFLDDDPAKKGQTVGDLSVLGGSEKLAELRSRVAAVFVAFAQLDASRVVNLIDRYDELEFKIVPSLLEIITEPLSFREFKDIPLITVRESSDLGSYPMVKRLIDLFLASLLVVILSPLFVLIGLAIVIGSPGPVFYRQVRVGKGRRQFFCHKFRTMVRGADQMKDSLRHLDEADGPYFKISDDPRVTGVGRLLRRLCLDELPQLFNVVKGDMSLVGPRPPLPSEVAEYPEWATKRFSVRPGMTGLWQVSGRHELHFQKALRLDLYYARHKSFWLDFGIIFKTVPAIIFNQGKW